MTRGIIIILCIGERYVLNKSISKMNIKKTKETWSFSFLGLGPLYHKDKNIFKKNVLIETVFYSRLHIITHIFWSKNLYLDRHYQTIYKLWQINIKPGLHHKQSYLREFIEHYVELAIISCIPGFPPVKSRVETFEQA